MTDTTSTPPINPENPTNSASDAAKSIGPGDKNQAKKAQSRPKLTLVTTDETQQSDAQMDCDKPVFDRWLLPKKNQ